MSNREQCSRILSCYSEEQLGLVLAFMRGIAAAEHMEVPNVETLEAIEELNEMEKHPEKQRRYHSFQELLNEVLADA